MSRPRISVSSSTRRPTTASVTLRMTMLTPNENTQAATTPTSWMSTCFGLPYEQPVARRS